MACGHTAVVSEAVGAVGACRLLLHSCQHAGPLLCAAARHIPRGPGGTARSAAAAAFKPDRWHPVHPCTAGMLPHPRRSWRTVCSCSAGRRPLLQNGFSNPAASLHTVTIVDLLCSGALQVPVLGCGGGSAVSASTKSVCEQLLAVLQTFKHQVCSVLLL